MSITFSGVGSGLPVSDWIDQLMQIEKQPIDNLYTKKSKMQTSKTTLNTVESKFSSLRSMIERLTDANLAQSFDLFSKKSATSSDTSIATATATNQAVAQSIKLRVDKLATATTASTPDGTLIGKPIDGTEEFVTLGDNQGKEGKFSIYVDNVKHEITIDKADHLSDIIAKIDGANINVDASITANGEFKLSYNKSLHTVKLGDSSDTSNFLNIMQISTVTAKDDGMTDAAFTSAIPLTKLNTSGAVTSTANLAANIDTGKFKIGNATFEIKADTNLGDLISQINSSTDSGVTARIDPKTNKLILTSKNPGQVAISMQDSSNDPANMGSNFLTAMGLIQANGNSLASQKLGSNAEFSINGGPVQQANSNTLTGDITGVAGLSVNLIKVSEGKDIGIAVNQDTKQLVDAVNSFVSKFNEVVAEVDADTGTSGNLKGEYSLYRIRNDLRQSISGRINGLIGSKYDNVATIGITSGSVGASVKSSTTSITLDADKLIAALKDNPADVKALLIGDKSRNITGIMQTMEKKVENALDPTSGYFASREDSMETSIADIEKSIKKGESRLEQTRARLVQQFTQMDKYISQMKSQSSSLSMFG